MFKKSLPTNFEIKDIKSHSSVLYNERLAILFYILDMDGIELNQNYNKQSFTKVRSTLWQIWKNIRTLVRNSMACRKYLHLETKDPGIYTIDAAFGIVNEMVIWCDSHKNGWTYRNLYIMTEHLNKIEILIRDVLQFFQYFIRPDFRQLPDILQAAEEYKKYADGLTVEQLREVVGKKNRVDFESLGLVSGDDLNDDGTQTNADEEIAKMEEDLGGEEENDEESE